MTMSMGSRVAEVDGVGFWYKCEESHQAAADREHHPSTPVWRPAAMRAEQPRTDEAEKALPGGEQESSEKTEVQRRFF